jgi:hypothetical protein
VLPAQEVGIVPVMYCARCAQLQHQLDDLTQQNLQTALVVRNQNQTISEFGQTMDRKLNEYLHSSLKKFSSEK